MPSHTARGLRRSIQSLATSKQARRYPSDLRSRIASYARGQLAAGGSLLAIGSELDVAPQTLERFLGEGDEGAAFLRVQVVDDEQGESERRAVVRGPGGVVIEGLGVEEIALLLRALS